MVLVGFPPMGNHQDQDKVMDYLLRDIPREVMGKLRAAAAIHGRSLKNYLRDMLEAHLQDLEKRQGMTLSVPKEEESKRSRGKKI